MTKPYPVKRILGLTGGPGTGKSTVAALLKKSGAEVVDADRIARELVGPGKPALREIVSCFGRDVLDRRGRLDRRALGAKVFRDSRLRKKLERILHPRILREARAQAKRSLKPLVVIDAPLLFETGLDGDVEKVVVVKASRQKQMERLVRKTGLPREELRSRIAAQMPLNAKIRKADFIIDNNGTFEQTKKQVDLLRRKVWRS